ncbi:MAG: OmpA family protein [Chitinophagaceae bacterium]|nr:OmpA family protein [Chitinophagaceae bacterium]
MASKKYTLLTGILCLLFSSVFSQAQKRAYEDSSVIPAKRMPQHTEFLNGANNFPAKPRNQWEVGIKAGAFTVSGDVPAVFPTPGFGLHVRKALGYVFSLRLEYLYGIGKGLHWRWNQNYGKNTPWVNAGYSAAPAANPDPVFYNYKTKVQDLSLQGIITMSNIRFHKAKTGFNLYGIIGFGGTIFDTKVNALDANDQPYNFASIPQADYKDRKDVKKDLKDLLDDSYESDAENEGPRRPKLFGQTFKPSGTVGAGIAFKLSNKLNLAIEDRITLIKTDLLDGQQWQEHAWGDAVLTRDFDSYNYLTVGLNINLGKKSVEPLWWMNPLDYAYSEIRNPKIMKLPKPVLPDADGDGVTDQFDLEQTPAGVPVDSHGVSRDTDGDGVPDSKDKELVTPTYCQPVDADGVGKCPVPCPDPSCLEGYKKMEDCAAKLGDLPSISFKTGSNALTKDAEAVLATVATKLRNAPECKVVVIGYCSSDKKQQQLSWDHVNKVITYLVEKEGLSADRFIFNYGQEGGDCNTVDLRGAAEGEDGPNTVAPPHPNLRKK